MNVRQVRKKIRSISNVKKITRAMQLVSAVKMKKAQQLEIDGRPYRDNLTRIIKKVVKRADKSASSFIIQKNAFSDKILVIIVSSNKGLCGAFNMNLFRFLIKTQEMKKSEFVTVGKKGSSFIARYGQKILADYSSARPLDEVPAIFEFIIGKYLSGQCGKVVLLYNKFISTLRFEQSYETLLPFELGKASELASEETGATYLVEPSETEILDRLLRSYIEEKIRSALISSEAVEHSARMIAMKNATDNATDVIYSFTLLGNKLRQEKITSELSDMVTAKESVEEA